MSMQPATPRTGQSHEELCHSPSTPKPVNVFYVWYAELCRRQGSTPLSYVKAAKPKNECVLDFVCDRIKPEEWGPLLNALKLDTSLHVIAVRTRTRCKFLHDVDTEDKVKTMKRRAGSLFTTFVLQSLLKSLSNCIRRTNVLARLELDGVPLGIDEVASLIEALKLNESIKVLTIKYCTIRDLGCQILCESLRQMPNIEVLDLTACGLGPVSAQNIAKIVKYQQINRYCESWHNSLRYEDPDVGIMAGLKRITLKNNPGIGDEGLTFILDELDDDLWIKALDMQRCGITENVAKRLLDVIEYSRSLEVADFRCNDHLSQRTLDQIIELIKLKHGMGFGCEYKWCMTQTTLREGFSEAPADSEAPLNRMSTDARITNIGRLTNASRLTSAAAISSAALYHAPVISKSEPLNRIDPKISTPCPGALKRINTCSSINRKCIQNLSRIGFGNAIEIKKSIMCLNSELQKETNRRLQTEIENRRLKHELHRIKSSTNFSAIDTTSTLSANNKEKVIKFDPVPRKNKNDRSCNKNSKNLINAGKIAQNHNIRIETVLKQPNSKESSSKRYNSSKEHNSRERGSRKKGSKHRDNKKEHISNENPTKSLNNCTFRTSGNVEFVFENTNRAHDLLERIIQQNQNEEEKKSYSSDDDDEQKLLADYFDDVLTSEANNDSKEETSEDGGDSTASLLDFMREIKDSNNNLNVNKFLQKVH